MLANTAPFYFEVLGCSESFQVLEFKVSEKISDLYHIEVDVVSENNVIDGESLLAKPAVLTLLNQNGPNENRVFHGEIVSFEQRSSGRRLTHYAVELAPKLWFLQLRSGCRIFQDQSVPQIIESLLKQANITHSDYRLDLKRTYKARDYCVQYHESEFAFLSRLMEEEGIFYYFEHELDRHILIISDHPLSFKSITRQKPIPYHPKTAMNQASDIIYELLALSEQVLEAVISNDYNFQKPYMGLKARSGTGELSEYHYPGRYRETVEGNVQVSDRLQCAKQFSSVISGLSDHMHLSAGKRFSISDYENDAVNREYYGVEVTLSGKSPQVFEEGATLKGSELQASFVALPSDVLYKPEKVHRKVPIEGIQTAFVVGPKGEEVYTDQYGRIKVQFHWDREGQYDENTSCWIRLQQTSAGAEWGSVATPRIGQEVIVNFLDGDPDRPMVTGAVYHKVNGLPFNLPSYKTQTGIKTRSYPGGRGFNEIRIDDLKGSEQLYIHSQKDFEAYIHNDVKVAIDRDNHESCSGSQYRTIGKAGHYSVDGDANTSVGGCLSLSIGKDRQQKVVKDQKIHAGRDISQKADKSIALQAGLKISLKAGSGAISLGPSGVSITGAMVKINSGGSVGSAKTSNPKKPSPPAVVKPGKPGKNLRAKGKA